MFDPLMALAFLLLILMAYLVGMALAVVGGVVWDGIKELVRRVRG